MINILIFFNIFNSGANQRPTSWSDDEQNNPFDDDVIEGEGVPVIALYDYVGAEEDELSFKAGTYSGSYCVNIPVLH